MNCFSRPYRTFSNILCRQVRLNKTATFTTFFKPKYKGIDKVNWMNKREGRHADDPMSIITVIVPITCFGLAAWQYNRKQWKDTLVEDMRMRMYIPAIDIPENLTDRLNLEYRRVKARGRFDHSKEMYIGPRSQLVDGKFPDAQPILFNFGEQKKPTIGFMVITPFKLADRDVTILVNRGWVPMEQQDPSTRPEGQIEGEIEIEGVIRLKEQEPSVLHKGANPRIFRYRDLEGLSELGGTSFFYIDAVEECTVPGGPLGGQTQVNLKNDHFQYLLTWTILGLYTSFMWHRKWIRKLQ